MNTTDEGFSLSFHKNYKLGPTYPRHAIFSLRELHQTSPSALRAETSSRYQSDPPENQIWHTDEAGASLACYQSTLISGTSFFSQWYFPSSGRSTNEILWEIVASSPFPCPSRLRRSLARSRETRFSLAQIGELARRLHASKELNLTVLFKNMPMYILWLNFILGLIFIFLCFGVWKCMIMRLKERKIKLNKGQNWTTTYTLYKSLDYHMILDHLKATYMYM